MNHSKRTILLALASAFLAGGLCACDRDGASPGQKLDQALDDSGEKVKEIGESIKSK